MLTASADLLFPRRCPVCDRPVQPYGGLICKECRDRPVHIEDASEFGVFCRKCGRPLRSPESAADGRCAGCRGTRHVFLRGTAVFTYASVRDSLYRFKYEGRAEYADYYSGEMAGKLAETFRPDEAQLIVPVPLDKGREKRRGYNQAGLLAEGISERTGLPFNKNALVRVRPTLPMKSVTAAERRNNLKNAFIAHSNDVKFKMIVLIDDIYTTGATMDACAMACLSAGAAGVSFIALAIGEDA